MFQNDWCLTGFIKVTIEIHKIIILFIFFSHYTNCWYKLAFILSLYIVFSNEYIIYFWYKLPFTLMYTFQLLFFLEYCFLFKLGYQQIILNETRIFFFARKCFENKQQKLVLKRTSHPIREVVLLCLSHNVDE